MPEVSVVMPVYNGEKYLREAIESILNQTFKDFEFLIIDDCSEDRSIEIIKSYHDKRIKLLKNNQHLGISRSCNKGIESAKGKYIARMDCDDISLPERLKKQVLFMEKNPHIAACSTWVEVFGKEKDIWKFPLDPEEIKCYLLFCSSLTHPGAIIRRYIFTEERILYDHTFDDSEDHELWVRIAEKFPMANLGEILIKYRKHDTQVSTGRKEEQILKTEKILKKLLLNMGINPTEKEFNIHSNIGRWNFENSMTFLDDAEAWLIKIYMENKKKNIYEEKALKKLLAFWWWNMCKRTTNFGFKTWKKFYSSILSKEGNLSAIEKTKFLIKCTVKKK